MEAVFAVQQKLKRDLGLIKIPAIRNRNYKAHGTKSYVHALNKFRFTPTLDGPYTVVNRIHQRGLAHPDFNAPIGGRAHTERVLVKHHGSSHHHHPKGHAGGSAADQSGSSGTAPASGPPAAAATGKVTADDQQNDAEYLCPVQIGTPAQTLNLDFDTGSSDLWMFSTELPQAMQQGHNVFNPANSSTFENSDAQAWQIQYGDGSTASGTVGTETVSIGGVTIPGQSVELADTLSTQFAQGSGDGLLGLAWPAINTITTNGQPTPQNTPVANMIAQGTIPPAAHLFTCALYSDRDPGKQSFYTFGYIDQDLVTASGQEISWAPVDNSQGFWMFASETSSVNGKIITQPGNTAIADTGTTLALVSDEVCKALYAAIPGAKYDQSQQGYLIPTSVTASQLPKFQVAVGGQLVTIQPEDLVFAKADSQHWYGGVQSRGANPFDILGDVFLKSIYAIWDQGNSRFGWVPKIQSTQDV